MVIHYVPPYFDNTRVRGRSGDHRAQENEQQDSNHQNTCDQLPLHHSHIRYSLLNSLIFLYGMWDCPGNKAARTAREIRMKVLYYNSMRDKLEKSAVTKDSFRNSMAITRCYFFYGRINICSEFSSFSERISKMGSPPMQL